MAILLLPVVAMEINEAGQLGSNTGLMSDGRTGEEWESLMGSCISVTYLHLAIPTPIITKQHETE